MNKKYKKIECEDDNISRKIHGMGVYQKQMRLPFINLLTLEKFYENEIVAKKGCITKFKTSVIFGKIIYDSVYYELIYTNDIHREDLFESINDFFHSATFLRTYSNEDEQNIIFRNVNDVVEEYIQIVCQNLNNISTLCFDFIRKVEINKLFGFKDLSISLEKTSSNTSVVIGPNGLGKSTILSLLASLLTNYREENTQNKELFHYILECPFKSIQLVFDSSKSLLFTKSSKNLLLKCDNYPDETVIDLSNFRDAIKMRNHIIRFMNNVPFAQYYSSLKNVANFVSCSNHNDSIPDEINSEIDAMIKDTIKNIDKTDSSYSHRNKDILNKLLSQKFGTQEMLNKYRKLIEGKPAANYYNDGINKLDSIYETTMIFIDKVNLFFKDDFPFDKKLFLDFSDNIISFKLLCEKTNTKINLSSLSSGEVNLTYLIYQIIYKQDDINLLLIDEPEVSLHIEWQEKLINSINEINKLNQLIIATHSPFMAGDDLSKYAIITNNTKV